MNVRPKLLPIRMRDQRTRMEVPTAVTVACTLKYKVGRRPGKGGPTICCAVLNCSGVQLFAAPRAAAHQAALSMGFSRQEYGSGLPCRPPGDLPNPGIEPASLASPALAGRFFTTSATWEGPLKMYVYIQI